MTQEARTSIDRQSLRGTRQSHRESTDSLVYRASIEKVAQKAKSKHRQAYRTSIDTHLEEPVTLRKHRLSGI